MRMVYLDYCMNILNFFDLAIVINILDEDEVLIMTVVEKRINRGDTMEIKQYDAVYTYDYDIINIAINKDYSHKCTSELEFGVYLDFDGNDIPVNLEMISASKIIGVDKNCLCSPNGNVTIFVGDIIKVEINFEFKNKIKSLTLKSLNEFSISSSQSNFALV